MAKKEDGEDLEDSDNDEDDVGKEGKRYGVLLDDSEDSDPARQLFLGGWSPRSSGLLGESHATRTGRRHKCKYRMEFILR